MCALAINLYVVEYLRFDPKRSASLYSASSTRAVLAWHRGASGPALPAHPHPHGVAPDGGGGPTGSTSYTASQQQPTATLGLLMAGGPLEPALSGGTPPRNTPPRANADSSSSGTTTSGSWWYPRARSSKAADSTSWLPSAGGPGGGGSDGGGSEGFGDDGEQVSGGGGVGGTGDGGDGWPAGTSGQSGRRSDMYSESDILRSDTVGAARTTYFRLAPCSLPPARARVSP
jgi:hypothetical protein